MLLPHEKISAQRPGKKVVSKKYDGNVLNMNLILHNNTYFSMYYAITLFIKILNRLFILYFNVKALVILFCVFLVCFILILSFHLCLIDFST